MPYPSRVDHDQIIQAATHFIETEGVDALTLGKLAKALGIKAPSLYRHVANKEALLQGVNLLTLQRLMADLASAGKAAQTEPAQQLSSMLRAYRHFAHTYPGLYSLAMTTKPSEGRPNEDVLVQMVLPMQKLVAQISGETHSLTALRGLFALVHGFVMLELHEQLQRGGDLDETFEQVVDAYLQGWM